jgi:hypothetical protein
MREAPPWAKSCRNPYVKHDWEWVSDCWLPDTSIHHVDWFNERCAECGLVVCRLIGPRDEAYSVYKSSTYPKDYKYGADEVPTRREFMRWRIEDGEERQKKRQQQRKKLALVPA